MPAVRKFGESPLPLQFIRLAYSLHRHRAQGNHEWHRVRDAAQFYWDFSQIPAAREKRLERVNPTLRPLVREINRRQAAGEDIHYSMHIYREIRWLLNFTSDIATTSARVSDLRQSLTQTEEQKLAREQQPSDGSWGLGINAWYLRFYYSVDDVQECGSAPRYPLTFLDRINSPEKLDSQLDSDLFDDFTKTGVFNREELDETFSGVTRLLFQTRPTECRRYFRIGDDSPGIRVVISYQMLDPLACGITL